MRPRANGVVERPDDIGVDGLHTCEILADRFPVTVGRVRSRYFSIFFITTGTPPILCMSKSTYGPERGDGDEGRELFAHLVPCIERAVDVRARGRSLEVDEGIRPAANGHLDSHGVFHAF